MRKPRRKFINTALEKDIDRIVTRAALGMGFLRAGEHAYALSKAHPNCGLTGTELANEIAAAAARAGVAVEIYPPSARAA